MQLSEATILDRVSVCRMMFYIDKTIRQTTYNKGFDCNTLEEKFKLCEQCANEVLQDVQQRRGIFGFLVKRVGLLKSEAKIVFREGLEPITITWEPNNE